VLDTLHRELIDGKCFWLAALYGFLYGILEKIVRLYAGWVAA